MKRRSKKFILVATVLLVISAFVDKAHAQSATQSAKSLIATQSASPSSLPSATASATPQLDRLKERQQEIRATVAQIHSQRISLRFEYYYKRLQMLGEGLEKQIDDLETDGFEVASQSAQLLDAQAELEAAKFLADEASNSYKLIAEGSYEEQKELSSEARTITQSAKIAFGDVLDLYKGLVESVKSLNS